MKNQFLSTFFTLFTAFALFSLENPLSAQSEPAFYYHYDRKVMLSEVPAQCVVAFSGYVTPEKARQVARKVQGMKVGKVYGPARACRYELAGGESWKSVRNKVLSVPGVHTVFPVYAAPGQQEVIMSGRIILQGKTMLNHSETLRKCRDLGLKVEETISMGAEVPPVLVCEIPRGRNPLESANSLQASGMTLFAHPNFAFECQNSFTPNDPIYDGQWFLNQASNCDINAPEAWNVTTGSSSVVVAIIDGNGYEMNHTELAGKFISPYDAVNDDNDPAPENQYANHGMPCAGLIGANTNNGTGIAGVGYNVKVLPIVIGYNANSAGTFSTTNDIIARAASRVINTPGVVAVSNSWSTPVLNPAWEQSYSAMQTNSRGGLGAAVLASTGNNYQNMTVYPCGFSFVVGIGATTKSDQRAPFSNFGNALDVVAPGVEILTTDRAATNGYSSTDLTFFEGTSAACPIAAGVCGLIGSVNPSLKGWEIGEILQYTTDKVGGYTYAIFSGKLSAWNVEMGYGRINAYKAAALIFNLNPNVSNITSNSALISWDTIHCAANYTVSYKQSSSNTWTSVTTAGSSLTLNGLACFTDYQVKVRPNFTGGVAGTFSNTVYFATLCGPPSNLVNVSVAPTSATVSWAASPCAFMYNVVISGPGLLQNYYTANTGMTFNNLQPSKTYSWRVRTVCSVNGSPASGFVFKTFTTPAAAAPGGDNNDQATDRTEPEPVFTIGAGDAQPVMYAPFPNPAGDFVTVAYDLPERDVIRLEIFGSNDQAVEQVFSGEKEAGMYSEQIDVSRLTPGIYVFRLQTNQTVRSYMVSIF